jgi:site-specific recombinase XerC
MTGTAPARKTPATADKVLAMVASARSDLKGLRDCALLLLGFAGAFRRSELVALDVADLQFCDGGVRITIRRSKTDQEGLSTTIAIVPGCAACPIRAVRAWINAAKISDGSVFRAVTRNGKISNRRLSGRAVAEVVKKLCAPRGFGGCEF